MSIRIRQLVAIYEIIAGLYASVDIAWAYVSNRYPLSTLLLLGAPLTVGILSIFAGVLLWRRHPAASRLGIFVQALQVPRFVMPGVLAYALHLGFYAGYSHGVVPPLMQGTTFFVLEFTQTEPAPFFCVNVLALAAMIALIRWRVPQRREAARHDAILEPVP